MLEIGYVNGRYIRDPKVSVEDRGYQFADGVYDVARVENEYMFYFEQHMQRLQNSLNELEIPFHVDHKFFEIIIKELMRVNKVSTAVVYIQVTRGAGVRKHIYDNKLQPQLVILLYPLLKPSLEDITEGIKVVTMPDIRWQRRNIKSISLLPNILAATEASRLGAKEAWLYEVCPKTGKKYITEGSSTNSFIVTHDNIIITHPADHKVLPGITRANVLKVAGENNIQFEERPFTVDEAFAAKEAFLTSTTKGMLPITTIDNTEIGGGVVGDITVRLRGLIK